MRVRQLAANACLASEVGTILLQGLERIPKKGQHICVKQEA